LSSAHLVDTQGPTPRICVVMPARNEEATVGRQVRAVLADATWRALPLSQIIVVDNGSVDATAAVARAAGAVVVHQPRPGYGAACLAGVMAADADVVLLMDADGSDDIAGAASVAALAMQGRAELVMGSRTRGAVDKGALTVPQRVGNAIATVLLRLLLGQRVSDLGPVRAIYRSDLLALGMSEMTYGWSTEMLVKAARARYRILEVPVDYHCRRGGQSKVSGTIRGSLRAGWCIMSTIVRYARWRKADPALGQV
jgi:glycosyltransferase involved in cell wall biosynthesis